MTLKQKFAVLAVAALFVLFVPVSRADTLPPGGTIASPSSMIIMSTGPSLANTGALPFSFVGDTGTVTEIVFQDTITGNLDFVYQVTVATGFIGGVTGFNFAGFMTNVGFGTPANNQCGGGIACTGTVAPSSIQRSADGSVVQFNFNPNISGVTTYALEIQTDASGFTSGSIGLIDGGGATLNGFAPSNSVPEPATNSLLGAGLVSLFALAGWRKKIRTIC
jgi:hypothetical protein